MSTADAANEVPRDDASAPDQHPTGEYASANADMTPDAAAAAHRRVPLFGTIFWGVVLLVFAVVMAVLAIPTITVDVVALTITSLVGLGALLVAAGIAASIRNRSRDRSDSTWQ